MPAFGSDSTSPRSVPKMQSYPTEVGSLEKQRNKKTLKTIKKVATLCWNNKKD